MTTEAHHRHLVLNQEEEESLEQGLFPLDDSRKHEKDTPPPPVMPHEASPLLFRHFSMAMRDEHAHEKRSFLRQYRFIWIPIVLFVLLVFGILVGRFSFKSDIVSIENAKESYLDIDDELKLWFRTWGNRQNGIPVLFVHGGPGNAVADYHDGNKRFFSPQEFFVIEVDQRGTGRSEPSVRNDWRNMKYYKDISIDKMSHDYELVRKSLGIDKWLVFGGSWGSTLSLDYGMRYPKQCLGLILRGIYLNTKPEFDAVFSRRPYENNPKRLAEFDTWFELAAQDALDAGEEPLDPNDAERFFRIYERMIQRGDMSAIWHYHVFENNLMEQDPRNLLDPNKIQKEVLPEATSVAFFETRLFLHGTFEEPVNLLSRVDRLKSMHSWVCQGRRDEVCPPQYAHKLVDALEDVDAPNTARFLNAGHEDTDEVMAACLKKSLQEFLLQKRDLE